MRRWRVSNVRVPPTLPLMAALRLTRRPPAAIIAAQIDGLSRFRQLEVYRAIYWYRAGGLIAFLDTDIGLPLRGSGGLPRRRRVRKRKRASSRGSSSPFLATVKRCRQKCLRSGSVTPLVTLSTPVTDCLLLNTHMPWLRFI